MGDDIANRRLDRLTKNTQGRGDQAVNQSRMADLGNGSASPSFSGVHVRTDRFEQILGCLAGRLVLRLRNDGISLSWHILCSFIRLACRLITAILTESHAPANADCGANDSSLARTYEKTSVLQGTQNASRGATEWIRAGSLAHRTSAVVTKRCDHHLAVPRRPKGTKTSPMIGYKCS